MAVGCSGSKPGAVSPKISVEWSAYSGTAIGAPTTLPIDTSRGWRIRTTLLALPENPGQLFKPLSARGRLFAQPSLGDPILANPLFTRDARIGEDDDARAWFSAMQDPADRKTLGVTDSVGVLAQGATLSVEAQAGNRAIELRLYRTDTDQFDLLVAVQSTRAVEAGAAASSESGRESVLIDSIPLDTSHPLVLIIPAPFEGSGVKAVAARFDFSLPSADESFTEAQQTTNQMLEASNAAVMSIPSALPTRSDAWSGYRRALMRDNATDPHRASLNFIASQTDAVIAHDLVVVADEAALEEMNKRLLEAMPQLPRDPRVLGWQMDLIALQVCADRAAKGAVPREMLSVLTIHAGEAGRNTAALADLIRNVATRSDFNMKLMVENLISLEDSSPASRVRAYDWLAARGKAPPGYDPLAPLPQRREALERALAPTAAPATGPTGGVQ